LEGFLAVYRSHELVLSSVFNSLLLDHRVNGDLRRFASVIEPRHLENDVPHDTVEAMMSATERHYPDIQQYFRWKAARLGLPRLAVSDVYAPIHTEDEKIPFPEARELVLRSFADFDPRFAELAGRFFDERWIDAEVRLGKRHGAFCASHSPKLHPWVLLSYAGTSRDVSTLAHELGHGVHAMLAREQPFLVADAPLVLAETASVFAEMLLIDALLRRASTPAAKARILSDFLDEIYGTIFRQNALTRFELSAHEARRAGRLSPADLGRLWRSAQSSLFGDAVEIPEIYDAGWSYIPHFIHSPFYCYSYTFGELLVLALFELYREEGAAFVPRYVDLLASGGSETPDRLLARLGLDVTRPEFWETGFRVVRRFATELAGLDVPRDATAGGAAREARL
ncbi:MAG: M3 family oligoendopeptidase, partial [Candidatus Binatia bacterium]